MALSQAQKMAWLQTTIAAFETTGSQLGADRGEAFEVLSALTVHLTRLGVPYNMQRRWLRKEWPAILLDNFKLAQIAEQHRKGELEKVEFPPEEVGPFGTGESHG